jgi:hypothetical protein
VVVGIADPGITGRHLDFEDVLLEELVAAESLIVLK